MNDKNIKNLLLCILIPIVVGLISSYITSGAMITYNTMIKPALSPPPILFPIVWTILYILMGISSYLVYTAQAPNTCRALTWYAIQLFFNFFWSILFFNFGNYLLALIWLVIMIVIICIMIYNFYKVNRIAAYLQIPLLLWCLFALYLNYSVYQLNM